LTIDNSIQSSSAQAEGPSSRAVRRVRDRIQEDLESERHDFDSKLPDLVKCAVETAKAAMDPRTDPLRLLQKGRCYVLRNEALELDGVFEFEGPVFGAAIHLIFRNLRTGKATTFFPASLKDLSVCREATAEEVAKYVRNVFSNRMAVVLHKEETRQHPKGK
jgi:hypothetical protein